jgi:hypothetical protein
LFAGAAALPESGNAAANPALTRSAASRSFRAYPQEVDAPRVSRDDAFHAAGRSYVGASAAELIQVAR